MLIIAFCYEKFIGLFGFAWAVANAPPTTKVCPGCEKVTQRMVDREAREEDADLLSNPSLTRSPGARFVPLERPLHGPPKVKFKTEFVEKARERPQQRRSTDRQGDHFNLEFCIRYERRDYNSTTINIDGQGVEVPKGINIIEAVKRVGKGKEVPHYCYHPKLSIAGNCRMCMVEMGIPMRDR